MAVFNGNIWILLQTSNFLKNYLILKKVNFNLSDFGC